jgi:hypothetical protein
MSNPISSIDDVKSGDIIRSEVTPEIIEYGVVEYTSNFLNPNIHFSSFHLGIPQQKSVAIGRNAIVEKIDIEEFKEYIKSLSLRFERESYGNGLQNAIAARRQHCLERILEMIDTNHPIDNLGSERNPIPTPDTGVYVVQAAQSGQGYTDLFQAIQLQTWLPENLLNDLLFHLFPKGFGAIYERIEKGRKQRIMGYRTFEIPESALEKIENPLQMEFNLSYSR